MARNGEASARVRAAAGVVLLALTGCGTSIHAPSSSSSGALQSESQPATGPMLGYVWDAASQALRPVRGIPGASIVGTAMVSAPPKVVASAVSAVSGMALFLDAAGAVFEAPLNGGSVTRIGSVPGATTLAMSNSGNGALVTGTVVASVITGLPQKASLQSLDVAALGPIAGGAVSDSGTAALATGSGQSGAVTVFVGSGAGSRVAALQVFGGIQFVPGGEELIVADGGSGALTAISHAGTAASSTVLSQAGVLTSPTGLDITSDGRWAVAANRAGDVLRVDLSGTVPAAKLHCNCAPSQVLAMSGTTVRLVTASGPLWIVDAGVASPRVHFIPAITSGAVATVVTKGAS